MRPDANSGEEVALRESSQVVRCDIFNTPFVNFARGNMTAGDQVTQPLRSERVDFVVISCWIHVYAVARLKDGGVQFEVMSRADVEKVRALSKAGSSGPWVDHFDEMAKKTVIRRLFKYLPVSIELQKAVVMDERAEAGLSQDNAAVITGEYSVVDDEQQSLTVVSDSDREEAREYVSAILNSLDSSAADAKAMFKRAEDEINTMP